MSRDGGVMPPLAVFGINVLLTSVSCVVFAALYLWPRLRGMAREQALVRLVAPHMFFRFIGLSFVVPGLVSPQLPEAFAAPAAYGDAIAGILAIIATFALLRAASWAIPAVWIFNIVGAADLIFAFYKGLSGNFNPGWMGAAYFLPTAIVPLLLTTHFLIFVLLVRCE